MAIVDNHNRLVDYLRLAVTDRCNLRCFYCMPADGIQFVPRKELLSYEEMERLIAILASMGVSKVRITGGEPFARRDLLPFLKNVKSIAGVRELHMTTNGVLAWKHVSDLVDIGIDSVNLSLDTMDSGRFKEITRRDDFSKVLGAMDALLEAKIPLKVNCVVMEGINEEDIIPMVELTRSKPISVRFIEEMPFNGLGARTTTLSWTFDRILGHISKHFSGIDEMEAPPHSTSRNFSIPDHSGNFGIIAAFSRTFCNACNRIRVTAQGQLKSCLYDDGALDLKGLLRSGQSDDEVSHAILIAMGKRPKDGFEAEKNRQDATLQESMSTIGG